MRLRFCFFLWVLALSLPLDAKDKYLLAITQIVEHPALNAVREGALQALEEAGYKEGETLEVVYQNAQGNISLSAQIAKKIVSLQPDAVLAISTPSAQTLQKAAAGRFPVIFAAVTDPRKVKLVENFEKPEANLTGVMDKPPYEKQLRFIKSLLPSLKTLGILFNPGEENSRTALEELSEIAKALEISLIPAPAPKSSDVGSAAQSLVGQIDAFYIPTDNTVVSALEAVLKVSRESLTPAFAADIMLVDQGLPAMIGYSYLDSGKMAGEMIARVFKGEEIKTIPVARPEKITLNKNKDSLSYFNLTLKEQKSD